jgi:hypothetical protein
MESKELTCHKAAFYSKQSVRSWNFAGARGKETTDRQYSFACDAGSTADREVTAKIDTMWCVGSRRGFLSMNCDCPGLLDG